MGVAALLELRKVVVHLLRRPCLRAGARLLDAEAKVLVDRQVGEDLALLRHVGDPRLPARSTPSRRTAPAVGRTNPMIVLSVVERPEPLRPSRLTISPTPIANPTPCRM